MARRNPKPVPSTPVVLPPVAAAILGPLEDRIGVYLADLARDARKAARLATEELAHLRRRAAEAIERIDARGVLDSWAAPDPARAAEARLAADEAHERLRDAASILDPVGYHVATALAHAFVWSRGGRS